MNLLPLLILLVLTSPLASQDKFFTRDGFVSFFSTTALEDIKAQNNKVSCVYALPDNRIEIAVLMKAFHFEKALMEEHFNENYVESEKFPKAVFIGSIAAPVSFKLGALTQVKVKGKMSMHGVTRDIEADGTIEKQAEKIRLQSTFLIIPEEYDIKIPNAVRDKIAREVKVNIEMLLEPFKR